MIDLDAIRARDRDYDDVFEAQANMSKDIAHRLVAWPVHDRRALLAEVDRLREVFASGASTMAQATDEIERLRQDRSDALSVTSRDGLLASEWVARTGKAERELAEAREWIAGAHRDGCESFWWDRGPQVTLTRRPCDCGRDKFLAKP